MIGGEAGSGQPDNGEEPAFVLRANASPQRIVSQGSGSDAVLLRAPGTG